MEKCEMKEIHTKEELTKVFEEEEDLVIVQHKRVARVLLRFAGHLPFQPQIKEVLTFIPLTAPNTLRGHDNDHGTGKGIVCDRPFT